MRGVAKRYRWRGRWVLRNITIALREGSAVKVVGANGSGKSTLLRLLAGVTLPTRGLRVCPRAISVGYAPDRLVPAPPFSVAGYLRHHARLRGLAPAEGERRVGDLAERFALTGLLSQRLGVLSKGSLQKAALIQAFLSVPGIVVLDEPFSGLDAESEQTLCELMNDYRELGTTVVFSDPHTGYRGEPLVDVIWRLDDGEVHESRATPQSSVVCADVVAFPGVLDSNVEGERIHVLAAPDTSDRVLAMLIERDWHIVTVEEEIGTRRVRITASDPR